MFTGVDIIKAYDNIANDYLLNIDRKKYYVFFELTEKYVSEKKESLIVSGITADYLLLNKAVDVNFMTYEVYCDDAVKYARELATLIYNSNIKVDEKKDIDLRLIQVVTKVPNKEIIIKIGDREIVNFKNLQIHGGVYIVDVVLTVERKGLFNKDMIVNCISQEHQLIKIYTSLSDPKECGEWSKLIEMEQIYRKQLDLLNDVSLSTIAGGRPMPKKQFRRIDIDKLVKTMYEEFASLPGHVVVGTMAINTNNQEFGKTRLEIITMYPLETEEPKIKKILEVNVDQSIHIETSINYPHVPTEVKIRKLTTYYVFEKMRRVIIDIFDTGTYSLISFNTDNEDGIRVGTLFVLAKHLLIDLWTIRYIKKRNQISDEQYKNKVREINTDLKSLFYDYDFNQINNNQKWTEIFPLSPNNYLGHYEDEELAIKRMIRMSYESSTKRYYSYFPYQKSTENTNQ